jgi:hypothetical protein
MFALHIHHCNDSPILPGDHRPGVTVLLWTHSIGERLSRGYWERFYSLHSSFGLQVHSIIGRVGSSWRSLVPLPSASRSILRFMIGRSWSGARGWTAARERAVAKDHCILDIDCVFCADYFARARPSLWLGRRYRQASRSPATCSSYFHFSSSFGLSRSIATRHQTSE